jgi:RNA-dependent RNA polymerase
LPGRVDIGQILLSWEEVSSGTRTVRSPVSPEKHYRERSTLLANSVDFGVTDADKSIIVMHTARAREKIQLMLNLDRKEIDIRFPQKVGDKIRNVRFRLPIALMSHIYKQAHGTSNQTALIIPFETPPQFFIQRYENECLMNGQIHTSFSTKVKLWTEWDTWFRETDVVDADAKKNLQGVPLMNSKDTTIIDLGKP